MQEGTYKGTTTQEKYFDVVFVMPDYGQKLDMSAYAKWTRIRFKEEHKYYPVVSNRVEFLSIFDAMKKSKGLLVITVPLGILFTEKAKGLRETLIDNGQLKTIIFLPKDSMKGTSIASAVLVIDVKGGRNSVRFVDVAMAGYTKKQGQAVVLNEVNVLVSKINGNENCTGICYVDNATIAKNHYNLSAKQYPLSNLERSFSAYMAGRPSIKLGQIASFKKAPNFLDSFEKREMWRDPRERKLSFALFEVAPSDINNDFLRLPKKRLLVSETELYRIHKKEFSLRPNDILLITKGASIGRVAFVTDTLTSDCIVGQFVTILRVKPDAVVSAESLFMLLRANIGQKLLSRFALGTSVANLPLTALKDLDVFIPTQKEQLKAQQIIQRNRGKERQITTLEAQKLEDYQQLWHLPITL